jgi:hypothetical protein
MEAAIKGKPGNKSSNARQKSAIDFHLKYRVGSTVMKSGMVRELCKRTLRRRCRRAFLINAVTMIIKSSLQERRGWEKSTRTRVLQVFVKDGKEIG